MNKFRLIGIRPSKGCGLRFRKNLKENQIYPLYDSFDFLDILGSKVVRGGTVKRISSRSTLPNDFFDVTTKDGRSIGISISAIAGKNGSGKSTIAELFFAIIYVFSTRTEILTPNLKSLEKSLTELAEEKKNYSKGENVFSEEESLDELNKYISDPSQQPNIRQLKTLLEELEKKKKIDKKQSNRLEGWETSIRRSKNQILEIQKELAAEIFFSNFKYIFFAKSR